MADVIDIAKRRAELVEKARRRRELGNFIGEALAWIQRERGFTDDEIIEELEHKARLWRLLAQRCRELDALHKSKDE